MKSTKIAVFSFGPVCAAVLFSCLTVFPSFAAETREEYRAEAAVVRSQIKVCTEELKTLREENAAVLQKYNTVKTEWRENKTLSIDEESWEKIRELRQQIGDLHSENKKSSENDEGESLKSAVQSGDYDTALTALNQRLSDKQAALEPMRQVNELWKQIGELL